MIVEKKWEKNQKKKCEKKNNWSLKVLQIITLNC
jgi:hypothetical protein